MVAAFARIVRWRIEQLGVLDRSSDVSPVFDALFAKKEPKTGTDGTMSWIADVYNANAGDDFVLMLKELVLPGGQRRPYSMWLVLTRVHLTGYASCCRSTCASSIRPGSA